MRHAMLCRPVKEVEREHRPLGVAGHEAGELTLLGTACCGRTMQLRGPGKLFQGSSSLVDGISLSCGVLQVPWMVEAVSIYATDYVMTNNSALPSGIDECLFVRVHY